MIKWLKQLLCDHKYAFMHKDYYKKHGQIIMYEKYICRKCGKHLIEEWRVEV